MIIGLLGVVAEAQAGTFNFTGSIKYHNDVVFFKFSLFQDATNVRVWTDSFRDRDNFDPIMALWTESGKLIAENDDNSNVNPSTQSYWDTGIVLSAMTAGNYVVTLACFDNFANGTDLAQGFSEAEKVPVLITNWWNKGTGYYSIWFDGVDRASVVPVPGAVWLLGSALIALAGWRRRCVRS